MKKPATRVTDHAVIRYLERVMGVDVEGLRRRIGRTVETGIQERAGGVIVNGFVFKLKGRAVTTIVLHNQADRRTGRCRRRRRGAS